MKITRREFLQKGVAFTTAAAAAVTFPEKLFSSPAKSKLIRTIDGFKSPYGISLRSDGAIWVTDAAGYCVYVFDASGKLMRKFGKPGGFGDSFNYPQGIYVDDEAIYIMDSNNGRITIYDDNFRLKGIIGTIGGYPEAFYTPKGIFVSDKIYACNTRNHFVSVFDKSTHKLIDKLGDLGDDPVNLAQGSREYRFRLPTDIVVDSEGKIYVVDSKHGTIKVLDGNGDFLFKFGSIGSKPGQLNFPEGIALDGENNIYVCDSLNGRIQKFDSQGKLLGILKEGLQRPTSLAINEENILHIVDADLKQVIITQWAN